MNHTYSVLLFCLLLILCPASSAQQLSHEELIEVLGIRSWRVPLPKDGSMRWDVEVVDYAPRTFTKDAGSKSLDAQQRALIVMRALGGSTYQLKVSQRGDWSEDVRKIALCTEAESAKNLEGCSGGYTIKWHDVAKAYEDGARFVIADMSHIYERDKPRKQVILVLKRFWGPH